MTLDNDGIRGADALLAVSKRLKDAGAKEARKALHRGVAGAAKPIIPKIRQAARDQLPAQGGLNERIARKPYRAQVRTGVKTAGVRITGGKVDPRINQGRVAHPVFGRPGSTVVQYVPEARGYFDDTVRDAAPQIRDDVVEVLEDFAKRLLKGL
jgi:hypothetical protein